jgi:hemoglobin-like flavoprotein
MNSEQIQLVQSTFNDVRPIAPAAAALFYQQLFTLDPALRPMFKGDMAHQGRMLMSMLSAAVTGLTNLEKLVPVVRDLGARHVGYGVRQPHYATVGSALLWTLEQGLGPKFTPEVKAAWASAYALLSNTMQEGAKQTNSTKAGSPLSPLVSAA